MADVISIDYDKMNTVAANFEQEAAHVKNVINELTNQIQVLRNGGWLADAATSFYSQMDGEVMPAMNNLFKALGDASTVSKNIVTTMQGGEEAAALQIPKA